MHSLLQRAFRRSARKPAGVPALDRSAPLPLDEWNVVRRHYPNLLIEGPESAVEQTLVTLMSDFRAPVYSWPDVPDAPDPQLSASVIVRNVAWFGMGERLSLIDWLAAVDGLPVQVIATSPTPLFELVERKQFPAELYYRLNVIRLVLA